MNHSRLNFGHFCVASMRKNIVLSVTNIEAYTSTTYSLSDDEKSEEPGDKSPSDMDASDGMLSNCGLVGGGAWGLRSMVQPKGTNPEGWL